MPFSEAEERVSFRDNRTLFAAREDLEIQLGQFGEEEPTTREGRRRKRMLTSQLDQVTWDILEANAGLAYKYAAKFCTIGPAADSEDYESAAREGLLQAVRSYRLDGGASFGRWAYPFIKRAVLAAVKHQDFPTLSSADFDKRPLILEVAQALQSQRPGSPVNPAEVAAAAEVPEAMVRRVLAPPRMTSLDSGVDDTGDAPLSDLVVDPDSDVASEVLRRADLGALVEGLRKLDDIELFMVVRKFGLDGEPAQLSVDLSRMMGASRQRVRDVLDSGLAKLADESVIRRVVA